MPSSARWEYKTIMVPSIDDWLVTNQSLAMDVARGKESDKVITKHAAYVDKALGDLGREGWELVSLWDTGPSQLFRYTVKWMTFKRQVG
jgi:hypothetical protein